MKTVSLLLLAWMAIACSAKVTSDTDSLFAADGRELKIKNESLSGTVDGQPWKSGKAIAKKNSSGEFRITIAGAGVELSCENFFPKGPHIDFSVPAQKAKYPYDGSAGGRLINFVFPYTTSNGGGSQNVLGSKSLIQIDDVQEDHIAGLVAALSPEKNADHSYEISGQFTAEVCGSVSNQPLEVTKDSAHAFDIQYAEALANNAGYEIRLMNKKPSQICDTFSGWMHSEAPIDYVSIQVPAKVDAFNVTKGVMEVGFQSASGGWSTDYFQGSGQVKSLSASQIAVAVNARTIPQLQTVLEVKGSIQVSICQ